MTMHLLIPYSNGNRYEFQKLYQTNTNIQGEFNFNFNFNDLDKVDSLKPFLWLALIILIIFFMDNELVHYDNNL